MRYYSSSAGAMTLTSDITAGTSIIGVSSVTGLPTSFPYTIVLDVGQAAEEICTVTSSSGAALTVTRGQDGTSAQAHSLGAVVRHMMTARDLREPQDHIAATSGVHGVAGAVVGTTDTQTLTNKDLTSGTNIFPAALATLTGAQTLTNKTLQANDASTVAATIKAVASQTANVLNVVFNPGLGQQVSVSSKGVLHFGPAATGVNVRGGYSGDGADTDGLLEVHSDAAVLGAVLKSDFAFGGNEKKPLTVMRQGSSGGVYAEVASIDKDGNITSPTITSLNTADTNLGNRIGAIETNLGTQTTFVASSAAKDGKRIHWETKTAGPTDASGYFTVTHNAGFTPTSVLASNSDGYQMGIDQYTATTFRMRLLTAAGAVFNAASTTLTYMCGE